MSKNILIVSAILRKNSNSDALANAFAEGAQAAGHQVEKISLIGKNVNFCRGCLACQTTGKCILKDDAVAIEEMALKADVLVFATPIYYYEMCGQLKTLLDRLNPLYPKDYQFREVYLLSAAADTAEATPIRALNGLGGWVECFPKAELKNSLFCGGVTDIGDIAGSPKLQEAYEMGKNC